MTTTIQQPSFKIEHPSSETSGDANYYILVGASPAPRKMGESTSPKYLVGTATGVCGGAPIILGTRISVHQIIELLQRLGNKDQIRTVYPHLTSLQIDAAIDYYNAHTGEIEDLIQTETDSEFSA